MVCCSCVFKLANRLVRNHKIDWLSALMMAQKGIERYETHEANKQKPTKLVVDGVDPDYSLPCVGSGETQCYPAGSFCYTNDDCIISWTCDCRCQPPLPNSHQLEIPWPTCLEGHICTCIIVEFWGECLGEGVCTCTGVCYYDCDEGYIWDGTACVPAVPPPISKAGLHPSKVIPLIAHG